MSKKLVKSFGYKALQITVLIAYSFFLVPVLLTFWDLKVYGTWIALYVIFNLVNVVEFGHSTYVGNEFNRLVHDQRDKAFKVLASAVKANYFVVLLELLVVYLFYFFGLLDYFLDEDIDTLEVTYVLLILFLYRLLIGSFRGVVVKALNPFGLIYKAFQFNLTEKIIEFLILSIAAILGFSLLELAWLWLAVKLVYSGIIIYEIRRLLKEAYPSWSQGSLKEGLLNFKRSLYYSGSNFLDRLVNDGIVLLISAFVGTTAVPLFAATRVLVNFGLKLSEFFLMPLTPEIINFYAKKEFGKILDVIRSFWFVTGSILIVGFLSSLFFIEPLFDIWTNKKLDFDYTLYGFLITIFLVQNSGKISLAFFTAINKTKLVFATSVMRVLLFFGFAYLFKNYELYGILAGLLLSELLIVGIWFPMNAFKIFDLGLSEKFGYYSNYLSALSAGVFIYGVIDNMNWLLILLSALPLILTLFHQYKAISIQTRSLILGKFKNAAGFLRR